jgi:hypothetical protein
MAECRLWRSEGTYKYGGDFEYISEMAFYFFCFFSHLFGDLLVILQLLLHRKSYVSIKKS